MVAKRQHAATAWRIVYGATLALWLGGLTFYSLFVVPTGNERLGATDQGILTAIVTTRLQWIGAIAIACIAVETLRSRRRWQLLGVIVLALSQIGLFAVHDQLSARIDFANGSLVPLQDGPSFYSIHRVYLLLTALQWLVGLMIFCRFLSNSDASDFEQRLG